MNDQAKSQPLTRSEINQKVSALAWRDDEFRKAFLADPKGESERRLGTKLPAGLSIAAHAEDENHLYFVIPAKPAAEGELTDEDLEKVAGGIDVVAGSVALTLMTVALSGIGLNAENKKAGDQHW